MYKLKSESQDEELLTKFDFHYLNDGDIIGKEEEILITVLQSPGHADDHLYLVMNFNKEIICGDNVLGYRSTVINLIVIQLSKIVIF